MKISYWVIAPEIRTDETVQALRNSWYNTISPVDTRFCVTNGSDSRVSHAELGWHICCHN
jgi:hypothetical protein